MRKKLPFLLQIYTWSELWICIGAAFSIWGVLELFRLLLSISHDIVRPILIWAFIIFWFILGGLKDIQPAELKDRKEWTVE